MLTIYIWPLYKECRGWQDTLYIKPNRPFFTKIASVSSTQAILKTYYFVNTNTGATFPEPNASSHRSAISLLIYEPGATINANENSINQSRFVAFPNPSNDIFNVTFSFDYSAKIEYKVFDLTGREVLTGYYSSHNGINSFSIDMQEKSNGLYILSIFEDKKLVCSKKLIKN